MNDKRNIFGVLKSWRMGKNGIDKETAEKLHSESELRTRGIARKLLKGDLDGAKADWEWIELSSRLSAPIKRKQWFYFGGVFILIFIVLCNLHYSTDIRFEVETENASLILKKSWEFNGEIISKQIFVDNLIEARSAIVHYDDEKSPVTMELDGSRITLNRLSLPLQAEIGFEIQAGNVLKLFVKNAHLSGELSVHQADLSLGSDFKTIDTETSETIKFQTDKTIDDPVQFEVVSKWDWQLSGFHAEKIRFSEEQTPGHGDFTSSICSGNITVLETQAEMTLKAEDRLILRGIECRRLDISKGDKGLKISFEGAASEILAGPKGFEKNLTLTWMEYLWNRKALGIFLLALLSFLGKNFYLGD